MPILNKWLKLGNKQETRQTNRRASHNIIQSLENRVENRKIGSAPVFWHREKKRVKPNLLTNDSILVYPVNSRQRRTLTLVWKLENYMQERFLVSGKAGSGKTHLVLQKFLLFFSLKWYSLLHHFSGWSIRIDERLKGENNETNNSNWNCRTKDFYD